LGVGGVALEFSLLNNDLQETFQNVRRSYKMNAKRNGKSKSLIFFFFTSQAQIS